MNWLAILKAVLSIADYLVKYCHDKQLLDAGQAQAMEKNNEESLSHIRAALDARAAPSVPEQSDPDNRDKL